MFNGYQTLIAEKLILWKNWQEIFLKTAFVAFDNKVMNTCEVCGRIHNFANLFFGNIWLFGYYIHWFIFLKKSVDLGTVLHTYNVRMKEADAKG